MACGSISNGCGRTLYCGSCRRGQTCQQGQCVATCTPACANKQCGGDGCGGSCGTCPTGQTCTPGGQCACVPNCAGKACGDDGCGGSCGTCAGAACSTATCSGGQCGLSPIQGCCTADTQCNDGNACTVDTCAGGTCRHAPLSCAPSDACHTASCDPTQGCVQTAVSEGTPCGGGLTCQAGVCACMDNGLACQEKNCGTAPNNCGQQVSCEGTCSGTGQTCGGGGTPNVRGCTDDGTPCQGKHCDTATNNCGQTVSCGTCTGGQTCQSGSCACPAGTMSCNGTCQHCRSATDCPSATCSTSTCSNGACGLTPIAGCCTSSDQCDDKNPCTVDTCDTTTNTCQHANAIAGTACSANSGTVCDGAGHCVQSASAADCPGQDTACQTRTCAGGACGVANVAAGTATPSQTAGDCRTNTCDGAGNIVSQVDDTDLPVGGNPCTGDVCTDGTPSHPAAAAGTACSANGGTVGDGNGSCVGCNTGADCPAPANATATCANGSCGYACNTGYADCNGNAADGCEVNAAADANNCGACGHACPTGGTCQNGICTCAACPSGQDCCDGACVNLARDPANCGACGHACPVPANGTPYCRNGVCGAYCAAGYADCDGNPATGCETNLTSDPNNCGACGHVCTSGIPWHIGACTSSGGTSDCRNLNFCSGHGICAGDGTCLCAQPYTGVACTDLPVTSCADSTTCADCQASTNGCVWCDQSVTNATGVCTALADCIIVQPSCSAGTTTTTTAPPTTTTTTTPPPPCNATTCPDGCCDARGTCQAGTSAGACGRGWAACTTCGALTCCSGACTNVGTDANN